MGFLHVMQRVESAGQAVSRCKVSVLCVLIRFPILNKHSASIPLPTEEEDNSFFKEKVSMVFILFSCFWAEGFLNLPRNVSHSLLQRKVLQVMAQDLGRQSAVLLWQLWGLP